jgi:hypothetical protein
MRTEGKSMCCPYGGWTIWAEPDLVRAVELLACARLKEQAFKLIYASVPDFIKGTLKIFSDVAPTRAFPSPELSTRGHLILG